MPKQSNKFAVPFMALLQIIALGSCGLDKKPSAEQSICASSLYTVARADVPASVFPYTNVDSRTNVAVFRSSKLSGACLSMISTTSSRSVVLGISGRAEVASTTRVSEIIFSSSRRLQISHSTNGTSDRPCSSETSQFSNQYADFKCESMSYSVTQSSPEPSPKTSPAQSSGGLWDLPWRDINADQPNYIYAVLMSPSTASSEAVPSTLLVTIKVP